MAEAEALLARYNPLLVTLPERPLDLHRPGRRGPCRLRRGDYHPISAELFLRNATLIEESGGVGILRIGGYARFSAAEGPSGDAIATRLGQSLSAEQTAAWHLDLTEVS